MCSIHRAKKIDVILSTPLSPTDDPPLNLNPFFLNLRPSNKPDVG